MTLLWYFLAGFCIFNSIPHLVKGIVGETNMTPFKRVSSPTLNIIWSFINLLFGFFLLGLATGQGVFVGFWDANVSGENLWAFLSGGFILSLSAAWLFSRPNVRLPWHTD